MLTELSVVEHLDERDAQGTEPSQELTADLFIRWANEIRMQPSWRTEADKCSEYYAGNQLDAELASELQAKGMGPLVTNLIAPSVNILLGTEAKTRTDWRVIADSDDYTEVAEAQSAKLFEAEREARADRACSDAYAQQIISGMGWVEVSRNSNPFEYPYRVQSVHRREMFWDWRAKKPDLSDAKYVARKRWYDIDEACNFFPESADVIRAAGTGWPAFWLERAKEDVQLMHSFDLERRISFEDWEWRNLNSRTVAITEVWYRVYVRGLVLELPEKTVEFDMKNPVHVAAVATGQIWPKQASYSKLRRAFFIGAHKIADDDMGLAKLPYVPFWGYREDLTGVPYGVVRGMIGPQDEVNARRRKLLWQLSAKRVMVDSDALDNRYNDFSDVVSEVARPDAVVVLNPQRRNANGFQVDSNVGLNEQQFKIMEESKQVIQEVAGIFNAMMGRESSSTSGLAINSLVEQGNTGAAEINDNYRYARRLVGELLLGMINEDMGGKPNTPVVVGEVGTKRKTILLNQPAIDEQTGMPYLKNDIKKAKTKVALEDVPSTPAYRAQMQVMLAEVMKSLPPQMQAVMAPYFIESTELQSRHEIALQLKKQMGMVDQNGEEVSPEVAAMQQQMQQMQQMMDQGMQEYQAMQQQLQEAQSQLKNKQDENMLRAKELDMDAELRSRELEVRAMEASASNAAERDRAALEREKLTKDYELRMADINARNTEASHAREAQLLAMPEPEERDEEAELAKIQKLIEPIQKQIEYLAKLAEQPEEDEGKELEQIKALIEPLQKRIEEIAAKEKAEPKEEKPAASPTINVSIGGKKKVTVQRDKEGNIIGAEVEEEDE